MISNEELTQIKERTEKATLGPWNSRKDGTVFLEHTQDIANVCTVNGDAEFIAHAREDVPRLVAEVERLRAELADIIVVAEEEAYESGYEDIITIAREALGE